MNCKNYRKRSTNPLLRRLTQEQNILSTEVKELNQDLLVISKMLKDKEDDLQAVNKALVQKTLRGPFLSIIESNSISEKNTIPSYEHTLEEPILTCIDGGKP